MQKYMQCVINSKLQKASIKILEVYSNIESSAVKKYESEQLLCARQI